MTLGETPFPETLGNLNLKKQYSPSLALPTCKKTIQGLMLLLPGGLHLPVATGDQVTVPGLFQVLGGEPVSFKCILHIEQVIVHLEKHFGGIHVQSICAATGCSLP